MTARRRECNEAYLSEPRDTCFVKDDANGDGIDYLRKICVSFKAVCNKNNTRAHVILIILYG